MIRMVRIVALLVTSLSIVGPIFAGERPVYLIKVSDNGRYFVDQEGIPALAQAFVASLLIGQVKESLHEIGNGIWGIPVSTWRS